MRAAGMEPKQEKPKKIKAEEIFYRPIEQVISDLRSRDIRVIKTADFKVILVIGDAHFPYVDPAVLSLIYEFIERVKPDIIIQMGDLYDMFANGKFARSLHCYNPFEEASLGKRMAAAMWETIRKIVPHARLIQLWGNHDIRPLKRVLDVAPSAEPFIDLKPYFTFDGVEVVEDYRTVLKINDINFHHGWLSHLGAHRDHFLGNAVVGHSHTGGVSFRNVGDKILWELNAGYIADPHSKALGYTPTRITKWTQGFGLIDIAGPRFIPA